jgi:hypothetical protein
MKASARKVDRRTPPSESAGPKLRATFSAAECDRLCAAWRGYHVEWGSKRDEGIAAPMLGCTRYLHDLRRQWPRQLEYPVKATREGFIGVIRFCLRIGDELLSRKRPTPEERQDLRILFALAGRLSAWLGQLDASTEAREAAESYAHFSGDCAPIEESAVG